MYIFKANLNYLKLEKHVHEVHVHVIFFKYFILQIEIKFFISMCRSDFSDIPGTRMLYISSCKIKINSEKNIAKWKYEYRRIKLKSLHFKICKNLIWTKGLIKSTQYQNNNDDTNILLILQKIKSRVKLIKNIFK